MLVSVCICVSMYVDVYEYFYGRVYVGECMYVCMYLCDCVCVCTCVIKAQTENNSAGHSNTKVLIISSCSCFSTYKTTIIIYLVDTKMHHNIKHLEMVLLDIK